jgi:hypothetical protein
MEFARVLLAEALLFELIESKRLFVEVVRTFVLLLVVIELMSAFGGGDERCVIIGGSPPKLLLVRVKVLLLL